MKELDAKLQRWVAAGLITDEQARAIRTVESEQTSGQVPAVAEAIGYLGGSLAVLAAMIAAADIWQDLPDWTKLSILASAAILLWDGGRRTRVTRQAAIRRLSSFLWLLSAAATGFFLWFFSDSVIDASGETSTVVAGLGTGLYAGFLWNQNQSSLQQLSIFGGLLTAVLGTTGLTGEGGEVPVAIGMFVLGLIWAVLVQANLMRPARAAYALASIGLLLGPQVLAFGDAKGLGLAVGFLSALALLAGSVRFGEVVLLGFGTAGIFLFLPQLVLEYLGDTLGAPVALFLTGGALMAAAVLGARLKTQIAAAARPR